MPLQLRREAAQTQQNRLAMDFCLDRGNGVTRVGWPKARQMRACFSGQFLCEEVTHCLSGNIDDCAIHFGPPCELEFMNNRSRCFCWSTTANRIWAASWKSSCLYRQTPCFRTRVRPL